MRIGVTGGTGFIGSYLIREHCDNYEFVIATSKPINSDNIVIYKTTDYSQESLIDIFTGCDAVIHLASYTMHKAESGIDLSLGIVNVELANNLFSACHEIGITNIVNASTVAVYNIVYPDDSNPLTEDNPCMANNIYGISKLAIERLANLYNEKFKMQIKSLRFAQGIGYSPQIEKGNFWGVLLNNSLEGKPIPVWGSGKSARDLIYVKDMARACICAVEAKNEKGIFNIGSGRAFTNIEVAKEYCKVFGNQIDQIPINDEIITTTYMNCEKANRILKWKPQYDLSQMISDIKKEYCLRKK